MGQITNAIYYICIWVKDILEIQTHKDHCLLLYLGAAETKQGLLAGLEDAACNSAQSENALGLFFHFTAPISVSFQRSPVLKWRASCQRLWPDFNSSSGQNSSIGCTLYVCRGGLKLSIHWQNKRKQVFSAWTKLKHLNISLFLVVRGYCKMFCSEQYWYFMIVSCK